MIHPKKRNCLRFSLAMFFVILTSICIWLGRVTDIARQQHEAIEKITAAEGHVTFSYESTASQGNTQGRAPHGPKWFRGSLGEEVFRTVVCVDLATNRGRLRRTQKPKATAETIKSLIGLRDVEILELGNNETVSDEQLTHLSHLRRLQTVYLYRTSVRGPGLASIRSLPRLESLSLDNTPLQDDGLKQIGGMRRLKWLRLENTAISDAGLAELSTLPILDDLSLRNTEITDDGLRTLESLGSLKQLDVTHTNVSAAGVARFRSAVPNCTVLTTFGLGRQGSAQVLFPVGSNPSALQVNARFKELGIDGEVGFDASVKGEPIVTLRLFNSELTDESLAQLVSMSPLLKELNLRRVLIGDVFLKELRANERLTYLSLQSTGVTDVGLQQLSELHNLKELVLNDTVISDAGLQHLENLENLERLLLDKTRVTDAGIRMLRNQIPRCNISY